jgi:isocitrate lyase
MQRFPNGQLTPDQSLYSENSVPNLVRSINDALIRAKLVARAEGRDSIDWSLPIVADAEAGFGAGLNAFELTKSMIEAGAAAVQFGDQVCSAKKCGPMARTVLLPTRKAIHKLIAARLAADILDVPTILIARTDANGAHFVTSDCDLYDAPFPTGESTVEGFFEIRSGIDAAIARGLAYAPYADMLWFEASAPNLAEARRFARAIHAEFPGKLLACDFSSSLRSRPGLNEWEISQFQHDLATMGYRFQFVTPAGLHDLNVSAFEVAHGYGHSGVPAYL